MRRIVLEGPIVPDEPKPERRVVARPPLGAPRPRVELDINNLPTVDDTVINRIVENWRLRVSDAVRQIPREAHWCRSCGSFSGFVVEAHTRSIVCKSCQRHITFEAFNAERGIP